MGFREDNNERGPDAYCMWEIPQNHARPWCRIVGVIFDYELDEIDTAIRLTSLCLFVVQLGNRNRAIISFAPLNMERVLSDVDLNFENDLRISSK